MTLSTLAYFIGIAVAFSVLSVVAALVFAVIGSHFGYSPDEIEAGKQMPND